MKDNQSRTDQQQSFSSSIQQTTLDQSQQALQQAIELQKSAAQMTLSALEWQDTAQRQGLVFTKSLLQSYVQGAEAVVPEMQEAMQQGVDKMEQSMQMQDQPQQAQGRQETQPQRQPQTQSQQYPQTGQWIPAQEAAPRYPEQFSQHAGQQPQQQATSTEAETGGQRSESGFRAPTEIGQEQDRSTHESSSGSSGSSGSDTDSSRADADPDSSKAKTDSSRGESDSDSKRSQTQSKSTSKSTSKSS